MKPLGYDVRVRVKYDNPAAAAAEARDPKPLGYRAGTYRTIDRAIWCKGVMTRYLRDAEYVDRIVIVEHGTDTEVADEIPADRTCRDCGRRFDEHDLQGSCPD